MFINPHCPIVQPWKLQKGTRGRRFEFSPLTPLNIFVFFHNENEGKSWLQAFHRGYQLILLIYNAYICAASLIFVLLGLCIFCFNCSCFQLKNFNHSVAGVQGIWLQGNSFLQEIKLFWEGDFSKFIDQKWTAPRVLFILIFENSFFLASSKCSNMEGNKTNGSVIKMLSFGVRVFKI